MADAVIDPVGGILFRHYRVSAHAVDRYRERIVDDIGQLIADLDGAYLFEWHRAKDPSRWTLRRHEKKGGYLLANDGVVFLLTPDDGCHSVTTVLPRRQRE